MRTPESIRGHFVLCYLSLVIQRLLEYQLKTKGIDFSTANVSIMAQEKGTDYYIKNTPNKDFNAMIQGLDLNIMLTALLNYHKNAIYDTM